MGKPLKRKTLKKPSAGRPVLTGGPLSRKVPDAPPCPVHGSPMAYQVERMVWSCTAAGCKQIAFPREEEARGRTIIGKGALELLRVDDPDGRADGLVLLRAVDNNVVLDVTPYLGPIHNGDGNNKDVLENGVNHCIFLEVTHYVDGRKKKR